jgi:uncharacterized protein (PEP-CTERM system associated)
MGIKVRPAKTTTDTATSTPTRRWRAKNRISENSDHGRPFLLDKPSILFAHRCRHYKALLLILAAFPTLPARADTKVDPSITAGVDYIGNIDLAPPGTPQSDDVAAELKPRLQVIENSQSFTGALDYTAQGLAFQKNSNLDGVHSQGTANGSWTVDPNLFSVDSWLAYRQVIIDPTEAPNEGNLYNVQNVANEFTGYLAPTLHYNFGGETAMLRFAEARSSYSGSDVNVPTPVGGTGTLDTTLQNSLSSIVTAKFASNDLDAPIAYSIDGVGSLTTFKYAETFRDDRITAQSSVRLLQSLRLVGLVGAETDVLTHGESGGLDTGLWSVGFLWAPSADQSLEARVGHRFFGPSYNFKWSIKSRLLKLEANYSEQPTTEGLEDAEANFVPGQIPTDQQAPAYTGVLRAVNSYDTYIAKQGDLQVTLTGTRTVMTLRAYTVKRDYLVSIIPRQSVNGGEFTLERDLNPRDVIGVKARLVDTTFYGEDAYRDRRYEFNFTHHITRKTAVALQAVRLLRDGTQVYRSSLGVLTIRTSF